MLKPQHMRLEIDDGDHGGDVDGAGDHHHNDNKQWYYYHCYHSNLLFSLDWFKEKMQETPIFHGEKHGFL
jgi:hypothetical protein